MYLYIFIVLVFMSILGYCRVWEHLFGERVDGILEILITTITAIAFVVMIVTSL